MIFLALVGIAIVTISVGAVMYVQKRVATMQDTASAAQDDAAALRKSVAALKGDAAMRTSVSQVDSESINRTASVRQDLRATESTLNNRIASVKQEMQAALDGEASSRSAADAAATKRLGALDSGLQTEADTRKVAVLNVWGQLNAVEKRMVAQDNMLAEHINDLIIGTGMLDTKTQARIDAMAQDLQVARAQISNLVGLPARLDTVTSEVTGLQQTKFDKSAATAMNATLSNAIYGRMSAADGQTLRTDFSTLNGNVATLSNALSNKADKASVDLRFAAVAQSNVGYSTLMNDYSAFKTITGNTLTSHGTRISALENNTSLSGVTNQLNTLSNNLRTTNTNVGTLSNMLWSTNSNVASVQAWQPGVDRNIANLQQTGLDYTTFKAGTNTKLNAMTTSVSTLSNVVTTLSNQQSALMTANVAGNAAAAVTALEGRLGTLITTQKAVVSGSIVAPGGQVWGANGIMLPGNDANAVLRMTASNGGVRHVFDAAGAATHAGSVKLQNGGCLEVGNDQSKEPDAGKICYGKLTPGALDVVGAGSAAGSRRVRLLDQAESGKFVVNNTHYLGALDADRLVRFKDSATNATMGIAGTTVKGDTGTFGSVVTTGSLSTGALSSGGAAEFNGGALVNGGRLRVSGSNCLELGNAWGGKQADAGAMCYAADGLSITGAGATVGQRVVNVRDNMKVMGNIDVSGAITRNGQPIVGTQGPPGPPGAQGPQGPAGQIPTNASLNTLQLNSGVNVLNNDPGPLIQKQYGSVGDRYGVGQFPGGYMRMYTSTANPGFSTNLSLANANGTFNDVVRVDGSGTTVNSRLIVNGGVWDDGKATQLLNETQMRNKDGSITHWNFNNRNENYIRGNVTNVDTALNINKGANINGGDLNANTINVNRLCVGDVCFQKGGWANSVLVQNKGTNKTFMYIGGDNNNDNGWRPQSMRLAIRRHLDEDRWWRWGAGGMGNDFGDLLNQVP